MPHIIELGPRERVELLFSYPNSSNDKDPLEKTVQHWFQLTLDRDQLTARGAKVQVLVKAENYSLVLEGPPELDASLRMYQERFPKLLSYGWDALTRVIPRIKAEGRWDPDPDTGKRYRPWRFFLPLGMAILRQRSLQFFHYPPIRLLEESRDYLNDPVPARCELLLQENGVLKNEVQLYETVADAVPIAAEDEQGSKWRELKTKNPYLIPIWDFAEYQKELVALLLNPAPNDDRYTIPIVVYGLHPRETFQQLYGVKLGDNTAATAEILPGKKTPVLAARHPYSFYVTAQGKKTVGCGQVLPDTLQAAKETMSNDLVAARWQMLMARDPSQDPQAVLKACQEYWAEPKQQDRAEELVQHQGSLRYSSGNSLKFDFALTRHEAMAQVMANKSASKCPPE